MEFEGTNSELVLSKYGLQGS